MARRARLKLLLDEMYPPRYAQALRDRGHDAVAVKARADLLGRGDAAILAIATEEGRALVTENARDFVQLAAVLAERGEPHAGLIFASPRRFARTADGVGAFVAAIERLAVARPEGIRGLVVWLTTDASTPAR